MALGVTDDYLFEQELEKLSKPAPKPQVIEKETESDIPRAIVQEPKPLGRTPDTPNVPDSVRKLAAELAINGAPSKDVGKALAISANSVNAYKNGATSLATYNQPSASLASHVKAVKERIIDKATSVMEGSLDSISSEEVKELSVNKRAQLARDMAAIVKDMAPQDEDLGNKGVQVVFFSPRVNSRDDYERIDAVNE